MHEGACQGHATIISWPRQFDRVSVDLHRLFKPASIAVVGASTQPEKTGHMILRHLKQGSFRLYPVNPNREEILGLRCFPTVSALPEVVDVAILSVTANLTVEALKDCVRAGVPFVISVAGGFSEIGEAGREVQEQMREAIRGTGTRLLGPNTMGLLVPEIKLDMFFLSQERSPRPGSGSIALVSQSGSVLTGVYESAEDTHVGLRACVGLGNKADLDENDFMDYFMKDEKTHCIALYLESFQDGKEFVRIARKVAERKPVVVLKVGTTASGARAASSHTGAMATSSDALVSGALRQAGVLRAMDEQELLDASKALANLDHIKGDRIAIIGSAGGFGVIATDYVASKTNGFGMRMAALSEETKDRLREKIPYFASVENPVDLTGVVTDQMYYEVLEIIQRDRGVDAVLLNLLFQPPSMTMGLLDVAEKWARGGKKPLVVCSVSGNFPRPILRRLEEKGVPTYTSLKRGVFALHCLHERGRFLERTRNEARHGEGRG